MKIISKTLKKLKSTKIIHCLIILMFALILSCATFCGGCCVFLPSVLRFGNGREYFEQRDPMMPNDLQATFPTGPNQQRNNAVFAMFYAPWCGYCKQTKPEWDRISGQNKDLMKSIDCEANKVLRDQHGITSYPTIRWFKNGLEDAKNYVEYTGARTASDFQAFINRQLGN